MVVFLTILFIGLFYTMEQETMLNQGSSIFFLAIMILANALFYIYWLWLIRIEFLKLLYSKYA